MIAEINVNIIKKCIFLGKLCNCHSQMEQMEIMIMSVLQKIFIYTAKRNNLGVQMHLNLILEMHLI